MTSFGLKLLAMISMVFDHIGFMFFENIPILRMLGRIAFPIFAFQLAIGYSHSKNKEKHILRMLIFAIASQIPYILFIQAVMPGYGNFLNIGFTFVIALLGMYVIDNVKEFTYKSIFLSTILLLSCFLPIDYGFFGVLLSISFYIFRNHPIFNLLSATFIMMCKLLIELDLFRATMLYALVPIYFYNGKKGLDNKFTKYLFYIFYPAHMLLFVIIKWII